MPDEFQGDPAESGRSPISSAVALVTLSRDVEVRLAALFESHGLTLRRYAILAHIAATPGLSLNDLARRSHSTVPGVRTLLRSLAESGLVRPAPGRNGFAAQLTVTQKGSRLLADLGEELA